MMLEIAHNFPMSLSDKDHFHWEVKITDHIKCVGVSTGCITKDDQITKKCCEHFWGYSCNGYVTCLNNPDSNDSYGPCFVTGDIIGVHVFSLNGLGCIEFNYNSHPLGVAFNFFNLETSVFYPTLEVSCNVKSSPSKLQSQVSNMDVHSCSTSLQLLCYRKLSQIMPRKQILDLCPPGLKNYVQKFSFVHFFSERPRPQLSKVEMVVISSDDEEYNKTYKRPKISHAAKKRKNKTLKPKSEKPEVSSEDEEEDNIPLIKLIDSCSFDDDKIFSSTSQCRGSNSFSDKKVTVRRSCRNVSKPLRYL